MELLKRKIDGDLLAARMSALTGGSILSRIFLMFLLKRFLRERTEKTNIPCH